MTAAPIVHTTLKEAARYVNGRTLFLGKNYLGWNVPSIGPKGSRGNTPLLIEADVAPHLAFYDGLYKLDLPRTGQQTFDVFFGAFITPEFRLRMVKNNRDAMIYSSPVRPMSFMPRIDLLWYLMWRVGWPADPLNDAPTIDQVGGVVVFAPRLIPFGHHSNGQEHCRYGAEGGLDGSDDGTCTAPVPGAPATTVNFRSGDFTTDYAGAGANLAYYTLDNNGFEHRRVALGATYQYNPLWKWLPGGMDASEAALYGQHVVHGELEIEVFLHGYASPEGAPPPGGFRQTPNVDHPLSGKVGVVAAGDKFFTTSAGVPSWSASLELSYALFWLGGAGLFVRGLHGRDYLNILFVEPAVNTVQFGLTFDQEPLFEYHGPR